MIGVDETKILLEEISRDIDDIEQKIRVNDSHCCLLAMFLSKYLSGIRKISSSILGEPISENTQPNLNICSELLEKVHAILILACLKDKCQNHKGAAVSIEVLFYIKKYVSVLSPERCVLEGSNMILEVDDDLSGIEFRILT